MKGVRVAFPAPRQVTLEEFDVGEPGPGQVLLRTEKTLISTGTELTGLSGEFPPGSAWAQYVRYPWHPGYSHVGRVVATGPDVRDLPAGTLVASSAPHASLVLARAERVRPLPPSVTPEEGTFTVLAATVLNGVRRARIELGETVVVVGAGLLGQLTAQFARLSGAFPLICIDLSAQRLELAGRLGALHTLAMPVEEAAAEVQRLSRGRGADVLFEVTGNPTVIPPLLKLARREARVILLGSPRGPSQVDFHDEVHRLGLRLIGAHTSTHPDHETAQYPWTRARNEQLFLELLAAGWVNVRELITHRYPAQEASSAYTMLLEDRTRAVGVILDWTATSTA